MQKDDLSAASTALYAGGIIAYPVEAVYGLGCDPQNDAALAKLVALKGRDAGKGMILIAADYAQLRAFLAIPDDADLAQKICAATPVPTSWVVAAASTLPPLLTGRRRSIAVRITRHPVAAALCRQFGGAITSTSANLSGRQPARSAAQVRQQFPQGIDQIVDAATGGHTQPSRIIDARTDQVLR